MRSTGTRVVFVHGLWLGADSWGPWVDLFREAGYDPVAPGWPGDGATIEETRSHPERVAGHGIGDIVEHYAQSIKELGTKPIVIGHSFGGLIVQRLLGDDLALRPGVSLSSELLPCENPAPINTVMLQLNSTYTYDDLRHPELTHVVFTTSSTGSSADTSGGSSGPSTAKSTGSVSNTAIVGSGIKSVPFRGTLIGTVNSAGRPTLRRGGKSVSSLKSGRYKIAVEDTTSKGGFIIEGLHRQSVIVTGSSFVGKHTMTFDLTAGQWVFYSSAGTRHRCVVVA